MEGKHELAKGNASHRLRTRVRTYANQGGAVGLLRSRLRLRILARIHPRPSPRPVRRCAVPESSQHDQVEPRFIKPADPEFAIFHLQRHRSWEWHLSGPLPARSRWD